MIIRSQHELEGLEGADLTPEERLHLINLTVRDLVPALLKDNRKDACLYPFRGDIEDAIEVGEVSIESLVAEFEAELRERLA